MASSPLIVDAQLSPNLVGLRLRQSPMPARAQQRGCLVGVTEPPGRPCRQSSLRSSQGWTQKLVPPGRNDGRDQVESHLGRNGLTSDAPYKAMLWLRKGFGFAGAWTVREQNHLLAVCFGRPQVNKA
jgi:hypothetical protein